ncbi:MAG: toprim domain-containing protein [Gemmatimonadaceae bacterium]
MEALPASPGAVYLAERGIPLDVALELGIGWGTRGALAGRVVFPLCGPDGYPTSATGRRIHETDDRRNPKYKALDGKTGYIKTLFNGGAVAYARRTGHPLIVVEGPLDAAACVAAGLPLAVASGSTSYARPEHFSDLSTVILALDSDDAGREGRRRLWLELSGRGIEVLSLPAAALGGCKDLGEYWQRHRTMPSQLMARAIGPHLPSTSLPESSRGPLHREERKASYPTGTQTKPIK